MHDLDALDLTKESRALTEVETKQEYKIHLAFTTLLNQEKQYWKQCSQMTWIQEGDKNIKYFHAVTNSWCNSNYIPSLQGRGHVLESIDEIGWVFTDHFCSQFGTKWDSWFKFS